MRKTRLAHVVEAAFWLALWGLLFRGLRVDWEVNPQYSYGWLAPFLALGLFWRRWETRPRPQPTERSGRWLVVAALLLLALFPTLLIAEANPAWRRMMWLQGGLTAGVTLLVLGGRGGRSWVRHFAFPVCFALVAIPWPSTPEAVVIQGLSRWVAGVVSGVLTGLGVPALVRGNLIELGTGVVGVEEACSGIRSLQSTFMLTLFFGEYFRLRTGRRLALVGCGGGIALAGNLGRTLFLTLQAARLGRAGVEQSHDVAGYAFSGLGFGLVWLLAWGLAKTSRPRGEELERPPVGRPPGPVSGDGSCPQPYRVRSAYLCGALLWLGLSVSGVELWYRGHEGHLVDRPRWRVVWPPGSQPVALAEREKQILRCETHEARVWQDDEGRTWKVYHLGWSPGRAAAQLASNHTPAICFTGAGMKLVEDLGPHRATVHGIEFDFRQYLFWSEGRWVHAFWCLYDEKLWPGEPQLRTDFSVASRLAAVRHGRRNLGQQVIEAALVSDESSEVARRVFGQMLAQTIVPVGSDTDLAAP